MTLLELLVAMAIIAIMAAISVPTICSLRERCCLKAVVLEITEMIREARLKALGDYDYAVSFAPASGRVSLLSGKGPDGRWNTADDIVVRTINVSSRGGGIRFGYGSYGPVQGLASDGDGDGLVLSSPQRVVCNDGMSGSSGSIYLITYSGIAMAIVVDSTSGVSDVWERRGSGWVKR